MTIVYLSYRYADSQAAKRVERELTTEARLRGEKIDIWGTHKLEPGDNWALEVEQRLAESNYVISLWSHDARRSQWLFEEANYALEDDKLVIGVLDDTPLPARFRHIQVINLKGWDKEVSRAGVAGLQEIITSWKPASSR
jgi:hypothetical protein